MAITAKAFVDAQRCLPILQFENRYRQKDCTYRWLSWNAVPEGDVFVCPARDVTQMKQATEDLAKSKAGAELREQFISILGHDLRNPLAGVICAVQFLEREERCEIVRDTANQSM